MKVEKTEYFVSKKYITNGISTILTLNFMIEEIHNINYT